MAAARIPAPDENYVMGLYRSRLSQGDESLLRSSILDMRSLVDMNHPVPVPPQYRAITSEVRTPYVRDTWQRITAALTQKDPVVHVEPRQQREDHRQAANIAERWTVGAFEAMLHSARQNVLYEAVAQLVRDQESVLKVVHQADAWANFPKRLPGEDAGAYLKKSDEFYQNAAFPFAWRVVDRLSMLFGDGEFGDDWALEYGEYPRPFLANRYHMIEKAYEDGETMLCNPRLLYGGEPKPQGFLITNSGRSVKWEYWDADWWAVVVDGHMAPGFPKKNPYAPKLPYLRARLPHPILWPLRWLVPTLDALLTMKTNWAYLGAYPQPIVETSPNALNVNLELPTGDEGGATNIMLSPGKILDLPLGKTIRYLEPPPVGRDLNEMIGQLLNLIEILAPHVLRGNSEAIQSGYQANQFLQAATLTYRIIAEQSQRQLQDAAQLLWWIVARRIRQPVYVDPPTSPEATQSVGLKPDGAVERYVAPISMLKSIEYKLRPVLPTDEQARAMVAIQLVNSPKQLVSKRFARESYLQVEDPEGMQDEIWVEDTLDTDPVVHEKVVTEALRNAGIVPDPLSPAAQLVGPTGQPLMSPYPPGQAGGGFPAVPGMNQPMQPKPTAKRPQAAPGRPGGRLGGAFPGRPGGVPGGQPTANPMPGGA